ncbi:MAG: diphosphate--fructose-6-phosphate 1-phosphotransferase [Bacilli bacterium]
MKYNAIYGQSGGPTSIINSSLYGVIKECKKHKRKIDQLFIMKNGIDGLISNQIINANKLSRKNINLLKFTPSAFCGSVRKKLDEPSLNNKDYLKIISTLKENNIRYIFLNGGNDSMDTALKLSKFFELIDYKCIVVGIPKTIDNDLLYTDHTPGFGSAAKFIVNTMQCLTYDNDCYNNGRVNIVEIMGRDTGWLTASSILASKNNCAPDLIYVPEVDFSIEKFLNDVKKIYKKKKRVLVAVSEGIHDKEGNLILQNSTSDVFHHAQLGGVAYYLTQIIQNELHIPTRAIELSILQRSFAPLISKVDQIEAINCGREAVKLALLNKTCKMITMVRANTKKYKIKYYYQDILEIANNIKYLDKKYINSKNNNINSSFLNYIEPLIGGKIINPSTNGLNDFSNKQSK